MVEKNKPCIKHEKNHIVQQKNFKCVNNNILL